MKIKIMMLVFGCDNLEVPGGIKRSREGGNHHMYQYMHNGSFKMRRREKETETFENLRAKSLPDWMKRIYIHSQEAHKNPSRLHSKRSVPAHISVKLTKLKTRKNILEEARKKVCLKGTRGLQ